MFRSSSGESNSAKSGSARGEYLRITPLAMLLFLVKMPVPCYVRSACGDSLRIALKRIDLHPVDFLLIMKLII